MSIELVVFDIAGTTVADNGKINEVFRSAFANAGLWGVAIADVDEVMGYRKKEAIEIVVRKYRPGSARDAEFIEAIHRDFTDQMVAFYKTWGGLVALPYAESAFREFHDNKVKVALNTGFSRTITTPILTRLGWDQALFIDEVICSDEVLQGRPHPDMIEKLMERFHIIYPEQVAKVGDTKVDIEEGRNAGCGVVVGVSTGACTKAQLMKCQPDYIIDSLDLLPSLIL
jgi:phosphonatase-like hydrolase